MVQTAREFIEERRRAQEQERSSAANFLSAQRADMDAVEPIGGFDGFWASINRGQKRGIALILGLPGDLWDAGVAGIYRLADQPEGSAPTNLLTSERIYNYLGVFNAATSLIPGIEDTSDQPLADTTLNRVAARISEEIFASAAALIPFLGPATKVAAAARVTGRAGAPAANVGEALFREAGEAVLTRPVSTAVAEAAFATGAGGGAAIAGEIAPGSPAADITGQLTGALGVGIVRQLGQSAFQLGRGVVEAIASGTLGPAARRRAGLILAQQSIDPQQAIRNIDAAAAVDVPENFPVAAAQAADDPGLSAVERARAIENARAAEFRTAAQNQAIEDALIAAGAAPGEPRRTTEFLVARVQASRVMVQRSVDDASRRARERLEALGTPDREQAGIVIREELEIEHQRMRDVESDLWQLIDDADVTIPMESIRATARDILGDLQIAERPENLPDVISVILARRPRDLDVGDEVLDSIFGAADAPGTRGRRIIPNEATPQELLALRSRILEDARREGASISPNRRLIARLWELHDSIMDTMGRTSDAYPELHADWVAANEHSRNLNNIFTGNNVVGRSLRNDRTGNARVAENEILPRILRSPNETRALINAIGVSRSNNAVRDFLVSEYRRVTISQDGTFNLASAERFMLQFDDALNSYPGVRQELRSSTDAGNFERQTRRRAERALRNIERSRAALWIGDDPDLAVGQIMSGRQRAQRAAALRRSAEQDPTGDAITGLRAAFWDQLTRKTGTGNAVDLRRSQYLNPDRMENFINGNRAVMLELGWTEADLADIQRAINASRIMRRSTGIGALPFLGDKRRNIPLTLNMMLSRMYNVQRGVVSKEFLAGEAAARFLNKWIVEQSDQAIGAMLDRALEDPALMRAMLVEATAGNQRRIVNRLRGYLLAAGVEATNVPEEDEDELNGE